MADMTYPGSHRMVPIEIEDDTVPEADQQLNQVQRAYQDRGHRGLPAHLQARAQEAQDAEVADDVEIIDLEEPEADLIELEKDMIFVDLTADDEDNADVHTIHQQDAPAVSAPVVDHNEVEMKAYDHRPRQASLVLTLRKGEVVELKQPTGRFKAQFLKIAAIIATDKGIKLRGHLYARTRNLRGILDRKLNEVALIAHVLRSERKDWNRQALVDIDVEDISKIRVLRTTNTEYPAFSLDSREYREKGKDWTIANALLVCRWQYVLIYRDARLRSAERQCEWLIRRITEHDADKPFAIKDEVNLNAWRGGKIAGGSLVNGRELSPLVVDLDDDEPKDASEKKKAEAMLFQRGYSGGDAFAGAGGSSRGMLQAGIKPVFAIDNWPIATETYKRNFPDTTVHNMDVFDFYVNKDINPRVDILHLSPPCQTWSPAHTTPGWMDEINEAALFSCGHLVAKVRPRIFTIEQTFGILQDRFAPQFNTLIGGFTSKGYSVRWKIVHFQGWGLCQNRKRLIVIGVAPGEHLPDHPRDTHCTKAGGISGLRPSTTVRDVIPTNLRPEREQHNLAYVLSRPRDKAPWNPNMHLRNVITCKGGQNYHWSGKRDFTVREYACLQGFPREHWFSGNVTACKKQIGNAVPPTMALKLFKHLKQWLKIQDNVLNPTHNRSIIAAQEPRQKVERIGLAFFGGDNLDRDDDIIILDGTHRVGSSPQRAINLAGDSGEDSEDEPLILRTHNRRPKPVEISERELKRVRTGNLAPRANVISPKPSPQNSDFYMRNIPEFIPRVDTSTAHPTARNKDQRERARTADHGVNAFGTGLGINPNHRSPNPMPSAEGREQHKHRGGADSVPPPPRPDDTQMADDGDDAISVSSGTAVGDDDYIEVMDLEPPERMGDHPIRRRATVNRRQSADVYMEV